MIRDSLKNMNLEIPKNEWSGQSDKSKLTVDRIFSRGAVLQRDKEISIWGTGRETALVTVYLGKQQACAVVKDGRWTAVLPPLQACRACVMKIVSDDTVITIDDIAIGEVWLAGGQSNMELTMRYDAQRDIYIPQSDDVEFRYYEVPKISYEGQDQDEDFRDMGIWHTCSVDNAPYFSAAAYYFGRRIRAELEVPVGIIGCSYGGTSAACWVEKQDLENDSDLNTYLKNYQSGIEGVDEEYYRALYRDERKRMSTPIMKDFQEDMMTCKLTSDEVEALMREGDIADIIRSQSPIIGQTHPYRPASLYYTMLMKVIPYSIKGVLWYQGESNASTAAYYCKLLSTLIRRWRAGWMEELPFIIVQLPSFHGDANEKGDNYPVLRQQQELVSKTVPKVYLVSIMDCGEYNDIHPRNKRPVGERLSLLALGKVYNRDILCEAPEVERYSIENRGITIYFRNIGEGLLIHGKTVHCLQVLAEEEIEIDKDLLEIMLDKHSIHISCPISIKSVRFAWKGYANVNLYNSAGLSAKPFEIEIEEH